MGAGLGWGGRLRWQAVARVGEQGGERRHRRTPRPDQHVAILINRQALALDEFVLQIFEGRVVELELPLQGAIGQTPPALEHGDRVVKDLFKGHCHKPRHDLLATSVHLSWPYSIGLDLTSNGAA